MKRVAMTIAVLGISVWGWAQNKPAAQSAPSGQAAGQTAAPAGKRKPMAKTQPEYDAWKTVAAMTDAAAQEKAAGEFATKYPDSELRQLLYTAVVHSYQAANNTEKTLEMAQKVLAYDADDPEALVAVAQLLAERTRDIDLDKDQRLAEARRDAQRALVTVDTDVPTSGYSAEQVNTFKGFIRSQAYYTLGTLDYNASAWADAEGNLRKSIDALPQQIDPVTVFRLSVALDMQNKYPEALKYANQAVELTKEGTNAGDAARKEKERLTELNKGATPPAK
jgi:tetratricopeptide (TPR) repeat protein